MTEPPSGWNAPDAPPPYADPLPVAPGYGYGAPPPQQTWYGQQAPIGVVPLRPLGVGELLDGAMKVMRRYPKPTLGLAAAIAAVVTLVNVALVLAFDRVEVQTEQDFSVAFGSSAGASGPGFIISSLAGLILTGALVTVVGKAVLGQSVSTSEVWATVRPRFWALLGLSVLTVLIYGAPIVIGVLLAVLLGFSVGPAGLLLGIPLGFAGFGLSAYFYTRYSLAPAALVLEKASVTGALGRSATLVRSAWWRTFGLLVLTGIITSVLSGILSAPVAIIAAVSGSSDSTGFLVSEQVLAGIATVIVSPFSSGVRALMYVDRRMRAEGLDVALTAAAAGVPPA